MHCGTTFTWATRAFSPGVGWAGGWVLLTGIAWIVVMTYICYRGIEVSANFQKAPLSIEVGMLLILSVVALVRVEDGHHPAVSLHPSLGWLNPFGLPFGAFASGLILMVFIVHRAWYPLRGRWRLCDPDE